MSVRKEYYYIILLVLAIIFVGASLRAPISSVGPLVPFFSEELEVSSTTIGFLNAMPLLAFGLFSPFVPKIAARFGMEPPLLISMLLLSVAMMIRVLGGSFLLFFGTLFVGLAITVGNVLLPGLIKASFPFKVGLMTGLYSFSMNGFAAISAGLSVPVATASIFDWRMGLAVWGVFSLIGLVVLLLRMPIVLEERKKTFKKIDSKPSSNLWKSPLAWVVTLYMGLQSLIPYVLLAWLPAILVEKGFMESEAGWLMAIYQGGFLPAAFIAPIFANKYASQRGIGLISGVMLFFGLLGTELFDGLSVVPFLILIGIGAGTTFAVAMTFFVERTHSVEQASQLSGMAQSAGYIIAACGPVSLGMLYERLGSWDVSLIILMVIALIISVLGFIGGKDRKVLE